MLNKTSKNTGGAREQHSVIFVKVYCSKNINSCKWVVFEIKLHEKIGVTNAGNSTMK